MVVCWPQVWSMRVSVTSGTGCPSRGTWTAFRFRRTRRLVAVGHGRTVALRAHCLCVRKCLAAPRTPPTTRSRCSPYADRP